MKAEINWSKPILCQVYYRHSHKDEGNSIIEMSLCSAEIIDFAWPEGNRKNLFITNIPGKSEEDIQVI